MFRYVKYLLLFLNLLYDGIKEPWRFLTAIAKVCHFNIPYNSSS